MTLNVAGDLERWAYKIGARARCTVPDCRFRVGGQSSETTGEKARTHTRETGHKTIVRHDHITEYRRPREGSLADELARSLRQEGGAT